MSYESELLKFLATYWGFAFLFASGCYALFVGFGKFHLNQESKDTLSLWLLGAYESTWSHHFCNLFDAVFGRRHLSWQCFFRSSLASVLAVLLLYVLFAEILGIMGFRAAGELEQSQSEFRAMGELSLWQAIVFGVLINIPADYLSLFETRWLLKRFERVQSVAGQAGVLIADAVFTGAIIWLAINAFQLLRVGEVLSPVEMLGLFSVFSLFFFSTFLTSVWAWIYCLSTWIMRLFSRSLLRNVLDVETKPVHQIALVGSAVIFVAALLLTPLLNTADDDRASRFDEMLCAWIDDDICLHVVRFTKVESHAFQFLSQFCMSSDVGNCYQETLRFFNNDKSKAARLWQKACDGGYAVGCNNLGWIYTLALGVDHDAAKAKALFQKACAGGSRIGCENLDKVRLVERNKLLDPDEPFYQIDTGPDEPFGDRTTGTVKWFNPAKGFGFITPDDGGKDVFFYSHAVVRAGFYPAEEGQRVEYQRWKSGPVIRALELKLLD